MRKGKTLSNPSLRKTLGSVGPEVAVRIAGPEPAPGFRVGVAGVGGPDITPVQTSTFVTRSSTALMWHIRVD